MKPSLTFRYCEHCNAALEEQSPPSRDQYEQSMIQVADGTVLLPLKLVKKRTKKGHAESHSESLNGVYCGPKCFKARLDALLDV
jgi:hypothetical protein